MKQFFVCQPLRLQRNRAPLAQLVEQQPFKLMVTGSNPVRRTKTKNKCFVWARIGSAGHSTCRPVGLVRLDNWMTGRIQYGVRRK